MSEEWIASVRAASRRGYISRGCERYLLLALDDPSGRYHRSDERLAAQLEVDTRTLRRWRREAKAAGLIDIRRLSWSLAYRGGFGSIERVR
jgi:hypothetical protein